MPQYVEMSQRMYVLRFNSRMASAVYYRITECHLRDIVGALVLSQLS
jgi:hypothetical protein